MKIKIIFPSLLWIIWLSLQTVAYSQTATNKLVNRMLNNLENRLSLSPEQKRQIEQVLTAGVAKIQQIRTERRNNAENQKERGAIMQEIQGVNKQIESVLDAEQKKKFIIYKQELREELRRTRQEKE